MTEDKRMAERQEQQKSPEDPHSVSSLLSCSHLADMTTEAPCGTGGWPEVSPGSVYSSPPAAHCGRALTLHVCNCGLVFQPELIEALDLLLLLGSLG